jgi:hypothetical protein
MEMYGTHPFSQITPSHPAWLEEHFNRWMVLLVLCMVL